jgi:hypothetical protein
MPPIARTKGGNDTWHSRTKDERLLLAATAVETAIATMLANDDGLDRVGALRLLVQSVTKKNVVNRHRLRTAATN